MAPNMGIDFSLNAGVAPDNSLETSFWRNSKTGEDWGSSAQTRQFLCF